MDHKNPPKRTLADCGWYCCDWLHRLYVGKEGYFGNLCYHASGAGAPHGRYHRCRITGQGGGAGRRHPADQMDRRKAWEKVKEIQK